MKASFTRDGALFDPQVVAFGSWFESPTRGVAPVVVSYVFGTNAEIIRTDTGLYYVEILLMLRGNLKYTWRSTYPNEESNVESAVTVTARTVV